MVLIDTSIWISLYRKRKEITGETLWMLVARNEAAICGQIWVEFLGGLRDDALRTTFEERLRAFPFLETTRDAYDLAAEYAAIHPKLGAGDAIIAATAVIAGAALWTADSDFATLEAKGLRLFG
jgi:predicted nucleic acid-binding protein